MRPLGYLGKMLTMEKRIRELLGYIAKSSSKEGVRAALVGGAIRDLILNQPIWDVDVVLECDAIEFAERYFPDVKKVKYKYYRTCALFFEDEVRLDLATAREESYPKCADRPIIRPSTIEKDLFRRDYTINAMASCLRDEDLVLGEILDPYGGRRDLERGILDVLHDQSFCDDPIRIIRGIRYAVRFGFSFSERCLSLIEEAKRKDYLSLVSKDRIRDEIGLCRKEPNPSAVFSLARSLLGRDLESYVV